MSLAAKKRKYQRYMAVLRKRAAAGDVSAIHDLGLWLRDGLQDERGRSLIRRNPAAAFRLVLRAVEESGGKEGAFSLGYAYDNGLGTKSNRRLALYWYRRAARDGSSTAAFNIATVYRDSRQFRTMFRWWMRATKMGDGDAAGNVGYCCLYGIGMHRSVLLARRFFRRAIGSKDIAELFREEALYHLAVSYLDVGNVRRAVPLLKRATIDNDYPEAMAVLDQIQTKTNVVPCRCRRAVNKELAGHAKCPLHG